VARSFSRPASSADAAPGRIRKLGRSVPALLSRSSSADAYCSTRGLAAARCQSQDRLTERDEPDACRCRPRSDLRRTAGELGASSPGAPANPRAAATPMQTVRRGVRAEHPASGLLRPSGARQPRPPLRLRSHYLRRSGVPALRDSARWWQRSDAAYCSQRVGRPHTGCAWPDLNRRPRAPLRWGWPGPEPRSAPGLAIPPPPHSP